MMKTISTLMMLLCICFVGSCTQKTEPTSTTKTVTVHKPKVIHVYFFDGFNKNLGEYTIKELHKTFDKVVFEGTIPFPDSAYYAPRNRYKADKLVKHLRQLQPTSKELVVGFSPRDISDKVHGYDDYGVMGWTRHSKASSVVSTYRLKDKSRLNEDFPKLVLHELGHADGLPHCKQSATCYMRDANMQNHFPELQGFCQKCTAYLKKHNWKLNQ